MEYTLGFEVTLDILLDYLEGSKVREWVVEELRSFVYMTKKGVPIPNNMHSERHMREVFPFLKHAEIDPITAKLFTKAEPIKGPIWHNRKSLLFKVGGVPAYDPPKEKSINTERKDASSLAKIKKQIKERVHVLMQEPSDVTTPGNGPHHCYVDFNEPDYYANGIVEQALSASRAGCGASAGHRSESLQRLSMIQNVCMNKCDEASPVDPGVGV